VGGPARLAPGTLIERARTVTQDLGDVNELTSSLDDVVHQRTRLGILTILHEGRKVDFSYLQQALKLTPGNLSQHLSVLEKSGLVAIEKGYEGKRGKTWVSNTRAGTRALRDEVAALRAIVNRFEDCDG
jgi:DNA-binding MarR family transcriptional regulator